MSTTLVAMRPRPWVLGLAVPLFAGIFALRLVVPGPEYAVSYLFFIPVVLIAIEYGLIAGATAAAAALVLAQTGNLIAEGEVPLASYASRGLALFSVGVLTGYMGERLRRDAVAMHEGSERFRHIFDESSAGIALVGMDGQIIEANPRLAAFLGRAQADLVGTDTLMHFAEQDSVPRIAAGIEGLMAGSQEVYNDELRVKRSDGELIWVNLTMSLIRDADGTPLYRLSQLLDVQAQREAEDQLRHQAERDPLSGVFNRRRFETELARELAHDAQGARSSAVLVFDVDEFKQVNDTLGHGTGDAVIVTLGASLEQRVRTGDVVARLGGDEFAVLMRRINVNDARRVADNIREHARDELTRLVEGAVPVGVSVGVAMVDGARRDTPEQLVERADMAVYEAKRRGGDRVAVVDDVPGVPAILPQPRGGEPRTS